MELEVTATRRRRQTRSGIYHHIYSSKLPVTKQTLAFDLKLSLPTVYQNLTELMDAGLIRYVGEQQSTGGRKPQLLDIDPLAGIAIGVSVMENRLRLVVADLRMQELAYRKTIYPPFTVFSDFCAYLAGEIETFIDDNELERTNILGIGIAIPGIISTDGSSIVIAPTLGLKNVPLETLVAQIPYPVHVENDATCGGHAEWFTREGQQNMAYLSLENGVGGAVLADGTLFTGDNRHSGEFGHMCVQIGGLPCTCGRQGCLEAYVSARRISDDLGIPLDRFFSELENGNKDYEALWEDLLQHLAMGIHNIRMILDSDVVLGGFLSQYLPPYLPRLKEYTGRYNALDANVDYLHLSTLGKSAAPLGAALHFVTTFLEQI